MLVKETRKLKMSYMEKSQINTIFSKQYKVSITHIVFSFY